MTPRDTLIEAMARAMASNVADSDSLATASTEVFGRHEFIGRSLWECFVESAEDALTALSHQGYALVPREELEQRFFETLPNVKFVDHREVVVNRIKRTDLIGWYTKVVASADLARPSQKQEIA